MTVRTVLVLSILWATSALAAQPFPVSWRVAEPISLSGRVDLPGGPIALGPFDGSGSWQFAEGGASGSGSIQVTVGDGLVRVSHSGEMTSDGFGYLNVFGTLSIEIDVPDLGESTTALVFVPEAALNQLSGSDPSEAVISLSGEEYDSSVLGIEVQPEGGEEGFFGGLSSTFFDGAAHPFRSGAILASFIAGDRVRLPIDVDMRADCFSGPTCSLSWSQTLVLRAPSGIAPEPQNRPQTQCFDGQDNDGDSKIDLADPDCTDPYDTTEAPPQTVGCGFGPELALLLPALWWLHGSRMTRQSGRRGASAQPASGC